MTEREWDAGSDPDKMLELLRSTGELSERKARLFACAAVRRVWHLLGDPGSRRAIEVAEEFADGLVRESDLEVARADAYKATVIYLHMRGDNSRRAAAHAAHYTTRPCAAQAACYRTGDPYLSRSGAAEAAISADPEVAPVERAAQAALLRDIFGPLPFRPLPPLPASARTWNDGFIPKLATAIYRERTLPEGTLDSVRLGVLADAMEESGVTDQEVLGHLRRQGAVHIRGCHVLDLILAKE